MAVCFSVVQEIDATVRLLREMPCRDQRVVMEALGDTARHEAGTFLRAVFLVCRHGQERIAVNENRVVLCLDVPEAEIFHPL